MRSLLQAVAMAAATVPIGIVLPATGSSALAVDDAPKEVETPPLALSTGATAVAGVEGDEPLTRVELRDDIADVWVASETEESYVLAGPEPTADVTRAVAAHRSGAVTVRMRFVNLKRVNAQSFGAFVYTPKRTVFAIVSAGPDTRGGRHQLVDYDSGRVNCPGFTHDIDYAAERVVMRIPRSCIGRPASFRLTMLNHVYDETNGTFQELTDNPHNRWSTPGVTPRLYRG